MRSCASPCSGEKLLELTDIHLTLRHKEILHHVNLQVCRGEILTIVGPNGAGKTTLLRVALGLLPPSSGRVFMPQGLQLGYMPQKLQVLCGHPSATRRIRLSASEGGR